jgi:uncharacterized membrane protein
MSMADTLPLGDLLRLFLATDCALSAAWILLTQRRQIEYGMRWLAQEYGAQAEHRSIAEAATTTVAALCAIAGLILAHA